MRITLKATLLGLFAAMAVVMIGQAGFAILSLGKISGSVERVATTLTPSLIAIGELNKSVSEIRIKQLSYFMASQKADTLSAATASLNATRARLAKAHETYEGLISSDEERRLYPQFKEKLSAQRALFDEKVVRLVSSDRESSRATLLGEQALLYEAASGLAQQLQQINAKQAEVELGDEQEMLRSTTSASYAALVIAAITAFAGVTVCMMRITKPLARITDFMGVLAAGDLDSSVPYHGRSDEIGAMSAAIQVFKDSMIRNQALKAESAHTREEIEVQRKKLMLGLADQFEQAVGGIVGMVSSAATEMQATAQQLSASAQQTSAQSNLVSSSAEQAGANVASVAAAAEELSASVGEIGRQVERSAVRARSAVSEAEATSAVVKELSVSAGRIDGIVAMISEIANQTNLLALNATIEGRARRRARPRLRDRGFGSEEPRGPDGAGDGRDRRADRLDPVRDDPDGHGDRRHLRHDPRDQRDLVGDRVGRGGAGGGDPRDRSIRGAGLGRNRRGHLEHRQRRPPRRRRPGSARPKCTPRRRSSHASPETLRSEVNTFLATVRAA